MRTSPRDEHRDLFSHRLTSWDWITGGRRRKVASERWFPSVGYINESI